MKVWDQLRLLICIEVHIFEISEEFLCRFGVEFCVCGVFVSGILNVDVFGAFSVVGVLGGVEFSWDHE